MSVPSDPHLPDTRKGPFAFETACVATPGSEKPEASISTQSRLRAVTAVAHHYGTELDHLEFRSDRNEIVPSPASLVAWVRGAGLWAKATRVRWRQLLRLEEGAPVVLLLANGGAALLTGRNLEKGVAFIANPLTPEQAPIAVDELRLSQVWQGDVLLIRRERRTTLDEAPFSFSWLMQLVLRERRNLREVLVASLSMSVLQILPPFLTMAAIDRVMTHHTLSTLALISLMLVLVTGYETLLGYARREIVEVMSTRLDARINVHVFRRLLALPVEFFERTPTGETTHKISQIFKIRDFLTGKLVSTILDVFTLLILLPFLFWMSTALAWMVLAASFCIGLTVLWFLPAIRQVYAQLIAAEVKKGSLLVETVHGMRTVKSLAIEETRKQEWDERVAESGHARLAAGRIANWAQTVTTPLERFVDRGVLMCGAYIVLVAPAGTTGITTGSLIAFMMLGGRVASPLIGLAKLTQDIEEVRTSISQVSEVLNHPTETAATRGGLRPKFSGQITFDDVSFRYPGSQALALNRVNFSIPAGTMLGLVGRSGSGKSTIARLLQGINRDYSGRLKIDGSDLREINLTHLRRSFGVVMQDNFLFRGTVRENIIAGRPGLTLDDVVQAARMSGAEEFIERLPHGYETWIEEGSANLSGGQRQRLAIARALIVNPRLLILDEATSALDPESEALVNANLLRIAKDRTMVIVSHRLSSLVDCDQILVMDKGAAIDVGPHDELLERCAIYRQLWQQQNRHSERSRQTQLKSIAAGE
ncbi:peptidase domain-containing ABC transporter [Methylobacterium soli]|uniref:peptidase domain-containing ABC transporter n=1 Tax=Methylobacterium soli TaxID=553447 RepID=UPI001EE2E520|nr:peptidase domain-containing ABC transporter [Methylobacterium soli]